MIYMFMTLTQTCDGDPCQTQTRDVTCTDTESGCDDDTKPDDQRPCHENVTCGMWEITDWSKVSCR